MALTHCKIICHLQIMLSLLLLKHKFSGIFINLFLSLMRTVTLVDFCCLIQNNLFGISENPFHEQKYKYMKVLILLKADHAPLL